MANLKDKFQQIAEGKAQLGFDPLGNDEARLTQIRIADIELDPHQPRKDTGDLEGLKASIQEQGILQPLIVSPLDEHRYLLVAGERRYTAAQALGLRTVPALVRTVESHQRLQIQLIENLHRKDLDVFEEANGYGRLIQEFNLTQEEVAQKVGKSSSYISQVLSVTKIPEKVRQEFQSSEIHLSRDTLYNIAKQKSVEQMLSVLADAQAGLSFEEKRERARKGEPRKSAVSKKPKRKFKTQQQAVVIVQSLEGMLSQDRVISALQEALAQAQEEPPQAGREGEVDFLETA